MANTNEIEIKDAIYKYLENKYHTCKGCGCLVSDYYAKEVRQFICGYHEKAYYCGRCKPNYDYVKTDATGRTQEFFKDNVPCDKNGKVL